MATREELELKKLELEVLEKRWPILRSAGAAVTLIAALMGAAGFFLDSRLAAYEKQQIEKEVEAKRVELAELQSQLVTAATAVDEMADLAAAKEANAQESARALEELAKAIESTPRVPPDLRTSAERARKALPGAVSDAELDRFGAVLGERLSGPTPRPADAAELDAMRRNLPVDRVRKILDAHRQLPRPPSR